MTYTLLLIKVAQREQAARRVQELLTQFGCSIKVRLGLHESPAGTCSPCGLIILHVECGSECEQLLAALTAEPGVTAQLLTI